MKTPKIMNNVPKMMRSAILAALAIAATACSNDLPDASDKNTPDTPNGKATIHVSTVQKADTRVAYEDGAVGAAGKLTWQAGDCLTVVRMQGNRYVTHESDYLYEGTAGTTSGEFTGTEITDAGDTWTVYYPNIVPNADGSATLPMTGQTQKEDNNTEHLRNYMLLADKGINDVYNDGFVLRMQSSIMKFSLSGDDLAKVGKLTKLMWMVETDAGPRSITLGFAPGAVTLDASKNTLTAFLSFMPQEMMVKKNGKFTVMLMGDKTYVAEITITDGKAYDAGKRYTATIDGSSTKWEEKAIMALTVEVNDANGLGFNIPFPESGKVPAKLTVDWGDGNNREVTPGTDLKPDDEFKHTYSAAGTYTITITSDQTDETQQQIPDFHFDNYRSYYGTNGAKLISIDTPLLNMAATNFSNCFSNCSKLQSIPSGLFGNNTNATNFSKCFSNCYALQSIPSGLFDKNTAATDFSDCFSSCSALQSIPSGLFDKNTAATDFSDCFSSCSALQIIPSGLFGNNTNETNFSRCFSYCSELQSIPSGLFDKNTNATNFSRCFSYCSALQSIPSGLFDKNTNATDFSNCFSYCSELHSIPSGLFDNNTKATDFSSCFYMCSALQSIPSGLFDNNTAATDFSFCFYMCSALQSIPSGLFNNNTQVTNFQSCFRGCTALKEIPSGLFNNNTQVTNFQSCFRGCTALKEIPQGLFDNNTAVSDFISSFENCSALQGIPPGLFDNNKQATNFNYCFSGCTHLALNQKIFSTNEDKNRFSGKTMFFASCFKNVGSALTKDTGGTAPDLWNYEGVTWATINNCFTDAIYLDNYTIIPKSWGGPFEEPVVTP